MKQDIYIIRKYEMLDSTLYTHELLSYDELVSIKEDKGKIKSVSFIDEGKPVTYEANRYFTLSKTGKGYQYGEDYLPYFATVTEDLPGSCKGLAPNVYYNCQLMTEKHGGYLQFFHPLTNQVLRIALNSHTYTPTN